jgi:rRNA maturation RNase YbeY
LALNFHSVDVVFSLKDKTSFRRWINSEIHIEAFRAGEINFVFCSDEYLLLINRKYLNHDYFTDIITFNYNQGNILNGDLFISIDRITENALNFKTEFTHELKRVMIHGILHLMGYEDSTPVLKQKIHLREDDSLSRFSLLNNL